MSSTSSSLLGQLRAATAPLHKQVEEVGYGTAILQQSLDPHSYRDLVAKQYLIFHQLEQLDALTSHPIYLSRLAALRKDLTLVGVDPVILRNTYQEIPFVPAHVLGILYVTEGSRLGGNIILRHLRAMRVLTPFTPFHFYSLQSENAGLFWKKTKDLLDQDAIVDEIVQTAQETFKLFHIILKRAIQYDKAV